MASFDLENLCQKPLTICKSTHLSLYILPERLQSWSVNEFYPDIQMSCFYDDGKSLFISKVNVSFTRLFSCYCLCTDECVLGALTVLVLSGYLWYGP